MKKLSCLLYMLSVSMFSFAQSTPVTPVETMNAFTGATSIYAPFELHSPYNGVGPVLIQSAAQVDFIAGERIHLKPGFNAVNFAGNGYFHAHIGVAPDFDVVFIEPNESYPQVGQFEKLEIGLQLDAQIEQQIALYTGDLSVGNNPGINPFDPDQFSVEAQFTHGAESYTVYGFYYEEYIRTWWVMDPCNNPNPGCLPAEWFDQNTPYHWRLRFAPPIIGQWQVNIKVFLGGSNLIGEVPGVRFNCIPSNNPGFLEIGGDGWHLRHSGTHESFFGIGQDLAWPDGSQFRGDVNPSNPASTSGGYLDILDWMTDMSAKGGNMTRIVKVPWSYEYEWEELNNYSQRLNRAWELDHLFETAELDEVQMVFCFEHGTFTLDDTGTFIEPELNWLHNPYRTQLANVEFPDDFLTLQSCRDIFKKKLRYFISRWGYSSSLGIFQLLSEMDNWTFRNQTNDPHLKHNGPAKLALLNWHNEMLSYCKELVPYRKLLCSTSYGRSPRDYAVDCAYDSPYIDIVCPKHGYHTKRDDNLDRFNEMNDAGFSPGVHAISMYASKPALIDETGFNNLGADANDMDYCDDITYHNTIWATSFMGSLNSGLYWWQWFNNDHRNNFTALNEFFTGVDYENDHYLEPGHWEDANAPENVSIETFYITTEGASKNKVMGWVHNASYYWGNILHWNCVDRNGHTTTINALTNDDVAIIPVELLPQTKFEIHGLANLSHYTFDFYQTRGNGGIHSSDLLQANIFGTLKPEWIPGQGDWAYKARRTGNPFRIGAETAAADTLFCSTHAIEVRGNHPSDSLNNFQYFWDFGNGQVSHDRFTTVSYSVAGSYFVTLIVSDENNWTDSLHQIIVVTECTSGSRLSGLEELAVLTQQVIVSPNPTSGFVNLETSEQRMITQVVVYSVSGELCLSNVYGTKSVSLDLSDLANGVYFIHVWIDDQRIIKRVIKS